MKIAVTQEHIDNGEPDQADACPVALALVTAGLAAVNVFEYEILATYTGSAYSWETPESVCLFVGLFDSGAPCQPFEFDIDLPAPATHDGPRRTVDAPAVHGGGRVVAGE